MRHFGALRKAVLNSFHGRLDFILIARYLGRRRIFSNYLALKIKYPDHLVVIYILNLNISGCSVYQPAPVGLCEHCGIQRSHTAVPVGKHYGLLCIHSRIEFDTIGRYAVYFVTEYH